MAAATKAGPGSAGLGLCGLDSVLLCRFSWQRFYDASRCVNSSTSHAKLRRVHELSIKS